MLNLSFMSFEKTIEDSWQTLEEFGLDEVKQAHH